MKKRIRILSLALSMVLLLCSVFPASADYLDGPLPVPASNKQNLEGNYGTQYLVTATYLEFDANRDSRSTGISVYHSGLHDSCLEGTVPADSHIWTASGNFPSEYRSYLWSAAAMCYLTYQMSNTEETFCIDIPMDYDKADYALYYGCWHYSAFGSYNYTGGSGTSNIDYVPSAIGMFTYVEY